MIREHFFVHRLAYQKTYKVGRYAEYRAQMEIVVDLLANYFNHIGVHFDKNFFLESIVNVILKNDKNLAKHEPLVELFQIFFETVAEEKLEIAMADGTSKVHVDFYEDENFIYVASTSLFSLYESGCKKRGMVPQFSTKAMMEDSLKLSGIAWTKKEGSRQRVSNKFSKLGSIDRSRRYLRLDKKKIGEKLDAIQ